MTGINAAQNNQPTSYGNQPAQAAPAEVVGQYGGQAVSAAPPSIASLVQDSLEELPSNLSEKMSKKLADRTAKNRSSSRIEELLRKYLKAVTGPDKAEKFHSLAQSLKQLSKPTPQQIRDLLDEHFGQSEGDGSEIKDYEAALLLALEEHFAADGSSDELLSAVREAKAEFGEQLKDFYKQEVQAYNGVNDVYDSLLGAQEGEDFMAAADVLISRLGNDLNGQGRKMEPAQLNTTLDSLYHLEVAKNTFEAFTELAEKMHTIFGVTTN